MSTTAGAGAANGTKPASPGADDGRVDAADEELARQLAERARAGGLSLTGPGGLLGRLTKVVLESALEGATVGVDKEHDLARGLTVSPGGVTVVGKGQRVAP